MPAIVVPPSPTVTWPVDDKIESPYGKDDTTSVYVKDSTAGEKDFTENLIGWNFIGELNRLEVIEITLIGLEDSDFTSYIKRKNTFKFFAEFHLIDKFSIEEVSRQNDYITVIKGVGMGITLLDKFTDQSTYVYNSADSNTITTALLGTDMTEGENENLGKVNGSWSWENKLSALVSISQYFDADWWVSQEFPYDTDNFNMKKRRGSIPVKRRYYDSGSDENSALITKKVNTEYFANDVILSGKNNYNFLLLDLYENTSWSPNTEVGVAEAVKESDVIAIYISADQTPQHCYVQVCDEDFNYTKLQEINVVGGRDTFLTIDVSCVKVGDVYRRPYGFQVNFKSHATNSTDLKIRIGRLIQLTTQFSAVNNRYTKIEADLSEPSEGVPFDISCQDSVWFPTKGIVHIGSDAIGYRNNEGNVLWSCVGDTVSGRSNAHRKGVLIFPTYDADGKNDTFLTKIATQNASVLYVQDTTGFSSTGSLIISDEVISYTGKTSITFTGCSRNQTGTQGGALPHSKYARVFEYDSTKHYTTLSPKTGSLIQLQNLKSKKWLDSDIEDVTTAEILMSSIMESNLDDIVANNGGLVSVIVEPEDMIGEVQKIGLGDTVYINSSISDVDDNLEVIGIRWRMDDEYGEQVTIECGNRQYKYIEAVAQEWKVMYG